MVMARAVRPLVDERTAALRSHFDDLLTAARRELADTFETRVAAATAGLTALDTRVGERLALLEKDDQIRYQQYDQAKPPQPVIKLGVRPRVVAAGGVAKGVEVEESAFARKAREKRQKA
ncbi:MAG: hypothetical protein NT075_20005 [Chloroflexi bacterium]|nr:hypothetical protein [Chloroflexota bacterium]